MILKPFSASMNIKYRDFINQNYFMALPGHGLKRINIKGINKISKENDPDYKEIEEKDIVQRKFEDFNLSGDLIAEEEKAFILDISKKRLESSDISFYMLGAAFSFEMLDILWLNETSNTEIQTALDVIKDSLIFSDKAELNEKFNSLAEKYMKFVENPSDNKLFLEIKTGVEDCIKKYKENPFSHIFLGMIYLRPSCYFNLNKSYEEFLSAKKYSLEIENHYLSGYCNFVLAWISYLKSDTDTAIELSNEAIDSGFMNIPEIYFNLAKYYASQKDHENALKFLDEAIGRFDFLYSVKADIDEDFSLIKNELLQYFKKLRDEEKEKVTEKLSSMGIVFSPDTDKQQLLKTAEEI